MATRTAPTVSATSAASATSAGEPAAPDRTTGRGPDAGTTVSEGSAGTREPAATRGRTSIAAGVVEKIAGLAAREVPGVFALGGTLSRTLGAVRDRVPGGGHAGTSRGVSVEVGRRQTAVDLDVMLEYGVPIDDVARDIRENVIGAVERMTGLEVIEVNISVVDVRLPDEEATAHGPRVQ
ncbi:Asp23/Gls24 family envelope stress response protein [Streptomyces marincola]|uniref:Asp23/Gls24 family envelope stress response protein n=1 Tax=Streptomyces marincola TaxID=2878388 RepID=A0A1W7D234_9ACTN|nr:Asp23/Gls24 family envelope stress response protein [Streptomyces marincola]ARQ71084.1 Asp23/Gls24 family envelope stress response protein [Streptomyces marincola]